MSNSKKKKSSKKLARVLTGRAGVNTIVILAVLILIVSIVTLSFSWFSPGERKGTGVGYKANIGVRSENCTIATYPSGVYNSSSNGAIVYNSTASTSTQLITAGSWQYFKTVITNGSSDATNVSLYLANFPSAINGNAPGATFDAVGLGIKTPSNTYRTYTSADTDIYIIRNAYVEGGSGCTTEIEWFVKASSTKSVTVDLSKLYIMYN